MTKCTEVVVSCLAGVVTPDNIKCHSEPGNWPGTGESCNRENMAFIIPLQLSFEPCSKNFPKQTNTGLACRGSVLPGILHSMNSHH